MQIVQLNTSSGIAAGSTGNASAVVEPTTATDSDNTTSSDDAASGNSTSTTLSAGLSNWDHQLQGEIASAQQALSFLDQSATQLQALKSAIAAKLAARQNSSQGASSSSNPASASNSTSASQGTAQSGADAATADPQILAGVQQFSNTWNQRQSAAGGSLDSQLTFTSPAAATQRFSIRGLTMANLQSGGKEVLSFSVSGASQAPSSVSIDPGLSSDAIVQRFNQALAPAGISVSADPSGTLVFSTAEASWPSVRDTLSVRGSGIRFPAGQMNRVKIDAEPAAITPNSWGTSDTDSLRQTLQQVVQALAQVQAARSSVSVALASANSRVASAQTPDTDSGVSMDRLAQNFSKAASAPGYESLLSLTSALIGISRDRVVSLLSLR
jgi:hypothetical protein